MNTMLYIRYSSAFDKINSANDFERIEVLSSEIDESDEFFLAPISNFEDVDTISLERQEKVRKRIARIVVLVSGILFMISISLVALSFYMSNDIDEMDQKEIERKRVARVVALVSGILFLVSVTLVAVSLYMSKDIDEIVRNSNEMLRKHNDRMSDAQSHEVIPTSQNITGSL